MSHSQVIIHSDGSCLGNPGRGGWAARLACAGTVKHISGGFALTTNNRMELYATIMGLSALKRPCQVQIYTDSKYVCNAIEKRWLAGWKKNGWRKADKKPVLNRDLWEQLSQLLEKHKVRFFWVEGHAGVVENEEVDTLARASASQSNLAEDVGYTVSS